MARLPLWLVRLLPGFMLRFAGRLRFPQLFLLTAVLFLLNLVVPDLIPFIDELMLGLATLLLSAWKAGKSGPDRSRGV